MRTLICFFLCLFSFFRLEAWGFDSFWPRETQATETKAVPTEAPIDAAAATIDAHQEIEPVSVEPPPMVANDSQNDTALSQQEPDAVSASSVPENVPSINPLAAAGLSDPDLLQQKGEGLVGERQLEEPSFSPATLPTSPVDEQGQQSYLAASSTAHSGAVQPSTDEHFFPPMLFALFDLMQQRRAQAMRPLFAVSQTGFSLEGGAFLFCFDLSSSPKNLATQGKERGAFVRLQNQTRAHFASFDSFFSRSIFDFGNRGSASSQTGGFDLSFGSLGQKVSSFFQLAAGKRWDKSNRKVEAKTFRSSPVTLFAATSSAIVFHRSQPNIDLFLSGELLFCHRKSFVEKCANNYNVFWKKAFYSQWNVGAGVSLGLPFFFPTKFTQCIFSLAGHCHSKTPDRFSLSSTLSFSSEARNKRGGVTVGLFAKLSKRKKIVGIEGGLNF